MNVQFACTSIFDCDRENLRFKPRAAAYLARLARHKYANAIAGKLTFGFLIETLHLRHQAFERARRLAGTTIAAEAHRNWLITRAEVKRFLELLRQFGKRHVFIDTEMFHERTQ